MKRNSRRNESGLYIVLFAIMMASLIILLALSLGLGLIAVNSTRTQQIANVIALSALEEYINQRGATTPVPLPSVLADQVATKATALLQKNRLAGTGLLFGPVIKVGDTVAPDTSGVVSPGSWFFEAPGDGTDPCTSNYPCFVPLANLGAQPPPTLPINSIRVEVFNQSSNPILAPFANFLGYSGFQTKATATAAIVQRCTAYLLDLSESSVLDSHPVPPRAWPRAVPPEINPLTRSINQVNFPGALPPFCRAPGYDPSSNPAYFVCPADSAMFAMKKVKIGLSSPLDDCDARCRSPDLNNIDDSDGELLTWCNIACPPQPGPGNGGPVDRLSASDPGTFRQDFAEVDSPFGKVWMDLYKRPEPLHSFFFAFNAGLREVRRQSTSGDLAVVIPFTADTRRRIPRTGMTPDIDYLVQLTNMDNVGRMISPPTLDPTVERASPNFAQAGWFPLRGTSFATDRSTDMVTALREAITVLQTECSSVAQKAIILATDGLSTCAPGMTPPCPDDRDFTRYVEARQQLLVGGPGSTPSVLEQLQENRIVLTTLLAGASVQPHFKRKPGGTFGEFLSPKEAYLNGLDPDALFDRGFSGAATEAEAFESSGFAGVIYRDPNWVFGKLSLESGGYMCPLVTTCSASDCPSCGACSPAPCNNCYSAPPAGSPPGTPDVLRDCARAPIDDPTIRPLRTCSPFDESTGEQAARCVIRTVGGNPYILVE